MFNLEGKVALVTGGSRGIGKGCALSLAEAGAVVCVNYVLNQEEAERAVVEIGALGHQVITVKADVSQKIQVEQMIQEIVAKLGKIDILVNNAGILSLEPFLEMKEETWDQMIRINLKGQFLVAQAVAKQMVAKKIKGKIINVASIASGQVGVGFPGLVHYCATKGGIIAMTEAMSLELGKEGINVNAIAPGAIETDMTKGMLADEQTKQGFLTRIPMGRVGQPQDIGSMAVFLASDESDYCTGATFYVDGGWLAG